MKDLFSQRLDIWILCHKAGIVLKDLVASKPFLFVYVAFWVLLLFYASFRVSRIVRFSPKKAHLRLLLYPSLFIVLMSVLGGMLVLFYAQESALIRSFWIFSFIMPAALSILMIEAFKTDLIENNFLFYFHLIFYLAVFLILIASLVTWVRSYLHV